MSFEWYPDKPYPEFSHIKSISSQLDTQPTILVAEALFITSSLLCLLHASQTSKDLVVTWFAAIISGTANDVFFMVLPMVDNFWHAQCTIMLTPRLPLYIPLAYASFQYVGVACSRRLTGAKTLSKCAYAGLCSAIFYAAYDLVGAKFLWWSWHTTDAATVIRWCGVPVGSTMWTLVHVFVFTYILDLVVFSSTSSSFLKKFLEGGAATALLTTPCMMLMMSPFQLHQLEVDFASLSIMQLPGKPDITAISLVVATFGYLANKGLRTGVAPVRWPDVMLFATVIAHFVTLALVLATGDPASVKAAGLHQTIGDCDLKDYDLSGYERRKYLCNKKKHKEFQNHNQYFDVCGKVKDVDWFTICGKGRVERRHLEGIAVLLLIGISLFRILVVSKKRTKKA
ncbi:hypothetical protein TrVE_jg10672 [Triparma verrucosa]|uniref:DUF7802 domain-containing protein n=1 Tax=Triparma verrucosa TaxID=1606542 RepID=A0A9W7C9X7_9STRA|nr:hypothetical protein TrVE_jg10672 [Triparma verrucosa]